MFTQHLYKGLCTVIQSKERFDLWLYIGRPQLHRAPMSKEPWWFPAPNKCLNILWCTDFCFLDRNVVRLGFISHVYFFDYLCSLKKELIKWVPNSEKKFLCKPKNVWLEGSYLDTILAMKKKSCPCASFCKAFLRTALMLH